MSEVKKKKLDISKIAFCTMILCVLSMVLLALYANQVQDFIAKVDEKGEGKVANVIWLIEHITIGVPVIFLALTLTAFYCKKENYVLVKSQKEQFYASLFTALFTYGVLMVYAIISSKSGQTPQVPEGEVVEEIETLWDITYKWFFVQVVPFLIMILYHGARAVSEEKELAENAEE